MDYETFLDRKGDHGGDHGFDPSWLPDSLFDFQEHLVTWALRKGRCALLESCGLGKTLQELVWASNVLRKTGRPVMVLTPLAVAPQTKREGEKFGIECNLSKGGRVSAGSGIVVTNYEKLHLFDPDDFSGVVCDESGCLKAQSSQTRKHVTRFMSRMHYRLLATATPAPNDYVELGNSSEAVGELSHSDMLRRFFQQCDDKKQKKEQKLQDEADSIVEADPSYFQKLAYRVAQTIGQWRLKHHAVTPFWRWVASWARACRMPSDLGFDDKKFILPPLTVNDHVIPSKAADGMLFPLPAFGMGEERAERRLCLSERCDYVASLVNHNDPAVIWCQTNDEGDELERIIPYSIQVAGRHSDEYKAAASEWFTGNRCICNDPMFADKLASWPKQNDQKVIGRSTIENIVSNALKSRKSMGVLIEKSDENIWVVTTGPIRRSGKEAQHNSKKSTGEIAQDTRPMNRTAMTNDEKPKNTPETTQKPESPGSCVDSDQPSKSTSDSIDWDVLSAEEKTAVISAVTDFMLTTITKQGNSEDCSAYTAISGSESFQTIQKFLSVRSCICGHISGKRKLITKSRIFGYGLNWQFCNRMVTFPTHSYEMYHQALHRCLRFGQKRPVTLDCVATEGEVRVLANMRRKAIKADRMFAKVVEEMNHANRIEKTNRFTEIMNVPSWLQ